MSGKASQLTDEQTAALAAYNRTVSLEAGAGCGKTFVLTERYLSYLDPAILEPMAKLDQLVAITFTDAAAREMRDRIRWRCLDRIEQAENATERKAWRKIQRSLDAARISTIHSFCANLLRTHAAEAGVDPQFVLLNQTSADLLKLRTLDQRLRQLLLERDERLIQLASHMGLQSLRETLVSLIDDRLADVLRRWQTASPEELIAHWKQHYHEVSVPLAVAEFLNQPPVAGLRSICSEALAAAPELTQLLHQILSLLAKIEVAENIEHNLGELQALARVQGPGKKKNWQEDADYEEFKDLCKAVRDLLKPEKSLLRRGWDEETLVEDARRGLDLLTLASDVTACLTLAKQEQNVLDFDDLLTRAHHLLTAPEFTSVQESLAENTRLLMVDEFQDTDPLQVAIVKAFCGADWSRGGLFVVGDFKQSIYRFRGAAPRVSRELRESLPQEGRLSLTRNFRSQGAILDFVNALFCDAFQETYEPLRPARPQLTPEPTVEFLWTPKSSDQEEGIPEQYGRTQRARYLEARTLARRLAHLIDSQEALIVDDSLDEAQLRPLRCGDVAILLRALSDAHIYEAAFAEAGLEVFLVGGHAFYAQQEIHDVLHLLRSLVSETDEISLAGVLRSPIFSLTDETIFWLFHETGSLHEAFRSGVLPAEVTGDERRKVLHAADVLTKLRECKDRLHVAELLYKAIELTGFDAILLSEFLGTRKLANLYKLAEQAHELDRTNPGDIAGFVTQLSEYVARDPKEALAATTSAGDAIQMMTIHNAKGLEFPFVVLPDLERQKAGDRYKAVFSLELGPLVRGSGGKTTLTGLDLHQFAEKLEDRNERLRLLYVACTRAADYLLLASSVEDLEKPREDWLRLLGKRFDLKTGQCLAELPPGYNEPQIRVTSSVPPHAREVEGKQRSGNLQDLVAQARQQFTASTQELPGRFAPIPPRSRSIRRFSFSRLSGHLQRSSHAYATDESQREPSANAAREIGSLVHAVIENLPLAGRQASSTEVEDLCRVLAEQLQLPDCQAAATEAVVLVNQFTASHRFAELRQAKQVFREVEFLLPWEAATAGPLYLQGYIDCLYQDQQGSWHLIDYKTNDVSEESVLACIEQYALQLYTYALAAEQTLGARPAEQTILFLRPGLEHSFQWSRSEANLLERLLNDSIAQIVEEEQSAA